MDINTFGKAKAGIVLVEKLNGNPKLISKVGRIINEAVGCINKLKTLENDKNFYLLTRRLYQNYMMERVDKMILEASIVTYVIAAKCIFKTKKMKQSKINNTKGWIKKHSSKWTVGTEKHAIFSHADLQIEKKSVSFIKTIQVKKGRYYRNAIIYVLRKR